MPFVDAKEFDSLSEADAATPADLSAYPRPQDPSASDATITRVWVQAGSSSPAVEIDYASGTFLRSAPSDKEMLDQGAARDRYEEMAKEFSSSSKGEARVVTVAGVPAFLVPDDESTWVDGSTEGTPGLIEFVAGGQDVNLVAHASDEELLQLATSTIQKNG